MFWNRQDNYKNIVFFIMAVLAVIFIAQIQTIALLAFASFILACSLNPAVDKLSSFKHISRALASTIVIIATILIIVLFFIPIFSISVQEIHQLTDNIPAFLDKTVAFLNTKTIYKVKDR